jgi:hypothetical protein
VQWVDRPAAVALAVVVMVAVNIQLPCTFLLAPALIAA